MDILVSACLLGTPCRYDGASRPCGELARLEVLGHRLIPVCPEVMGGLPTPRPPAELQRDGRVVDRAGKDVTEAYRLGAEEVLELARAHRCTLAVLKERSPSCGRGQIYDGSFTGRLTEGSGVTARLLEEHGVQVYGESEAGTLAERVPPFALQISREKRLTYRKFYAIFCSNLTGVYLAKNTGTTPPGVKAIRTAGSIADRRVTALID